MNTMEVLEIEDSGGFDLPEVMGEYVPSLIPISGSGLTSSH